MNLARFLTLAFLCAVLAPAAQAQWMPSGATGQSVMGISDPGRALALAAGARVLLVGQEDRRLSVVDPDSGTVLGQVALPHEPRSVAVSADGARAYVVYGNGKLTAVDVGARAVLATWSIGGDLRSVVLMPGEAELAVADAGPNRLLGVDAGSGAISRQVSLAHEPREVVSTNGGSRLAVGSVNGWLVTVDAAAFTVLSQLKIADEIRALAWWQAGARLLAVHKRADAVSLVDAAVPQVTSTVQLDGDPDRGAVAQNAGVGYVGTHDDASVNRVDLAGPALLGRYAVASRVNALVFDPVANVLYGAPRGDSQLLRLDPAAASLISVLQLQKRLRDVAVNQATHEAAAVADKSDELFVIRLSDRSVRSIALPARPDLVAVDANLNHAAVAFRGSGAKLRFADLSANTLFAESISYDKNLNALAVDSTRALLLAIAEGERPVLFVDLNTRTRLADGPAERYRALAVHAGRGVAYLATEDRQLKVMDLASRAIIATLELGFKVNAIVVDEALDKALLTTGSENKAHVLNLGILAFEASHALPNNPGAAALQPDTHVAVVASRESDALSLVDLAGGTATPNFTSVEKAHTLAVSKRFNQAVVLSGERDEVAFVQLPNPVPALQTLSPAHAPAGSAALVLSLTGTGFVDASKAYFGATALVTRWQSATELQADVPAELLATAGSVQVTVQNPAPAGGTSNALAFNVLGAPTLAAIAPPSAVADGEPKALQLTGTNFVDGATVLFGTSTLPGIFNGPTSLTVVVPSALTATAGTFQVSVINPGGLLSNALPFTLTPSLAIHAIAPTTGDVGTVVTLSGSGFDSAPAANQLVFRGMDNTTVPAAALTATPTQITVRVPPLADSGPITLTNSRGTVQSPPFTVNREQDFQLVVNPAAVTVYQGASNLVQAQLSSTGTRSFTGLVTLSVEGLPSGVTATFSPAQVLSAFQTGAITLAGSGSATPGNYGATVKATFSEGGVPFVRASPLAVTIAASTDVTGLKGRFVTPEGQGIAGVIVRADTGQNPQSQTVADAAGNFVLTGLPAGQVTLRFDATPANPLYPIWPYTTGIVANQFTVLADFTINPPPSDDKFTPISNAAQDQIVTDERFPGLEIKLPAGVSIVGWDGVPKTRIAVERVTPDKLPVSAPPFPMREAYQLHFGTPMGGIPSGPIPVTLPNVAEAEPGELLDIWFFDGSPMGGTGEWKIAGQGRVSDDGKTVAMLAGQGLTRFCGVCGLVSLSCPPPPKPPQPPNPPCNSGNPVNLFTGQEMPVRRGGLSCTGITQIEVGMSYNPVDAFGGRAGTFGSLGLGWTLDYDIAFLPFTGPQKRLVLPPGKFVDFVDDGTGTYRNSDNPSFDGAIIRATNQSANEWELKYKDGQIWKFKPFAGIPGVIRGGPPTFVTEIVDPQGNSLKVARLANGRVSTVGGQQRNITFEYGANGFVSQVRDTANRTMAFTYTADNAIETITDEDGKVTRITYVGDSEIAPDAACGVQPTMGKRIKTIAYPGRDNPTQNFYGPGRRVLRQVGWDGREQKFRYRVIGSCITHVSNPGVKCAGASCPTEDTWENFQAGWRIHGGQVVATSIVQPNGESYSQVFDSKGAYVAQVDNQGQALKVKRDQVGRITERTDAIGRTWKYAYDAVGNIQTQVDPLGRVTAYTYDSKWNTIATVTRFDEANQPVVRSYHYDQDRGSILRSTDPLNHSTIYDYTARGQLSSVTTATGQQTSYEYNAAGDLVRMIDPGGNEMLYGTDGAGRVVSRTNALGFASKTEYTGTDRVSKTIDPLLQETRYTRDAANRISSVINPLNNTVETYEYDSGDRVAKRIDALGRFTAYTYDASGRLETMTDRNGRTTSYEYDQQNRAVRVVRHDRVQTLEYDAVGRLARIDDGFSHVSYTYDLADRIVREINSAGGQTTTIEYEYDALDRRTARTVTSTGPNGNSGPDVTRYAYDAAGRLLSVTYKGTGELNEITGYEWDASGRLVRKTLPNGIITEFDYDLSSRLSQITYKKSDGSVIEQISYGIDAAGRRTSKTTSGANAAQETPFTASYDVANRMTSITLDPSGPAPRTYGLTYDDNGNLLRKESVSDPIDVTMFQWDASNRLTQIEGPGYAASFTYDVIGRRVTRIVNGDTTAFAYSGMQLVGEIRTASTSQQTTAYVTGAQIDEVIARYSRTGATSNTPVGRVLLTDALGSVIAQTREDQTVQNFYSYTPYGEVLTLGGDEGNSIQYTGRENDSTGVYFYRARYYDPVLKRFIAQDPLGLSGGMNVYGYVEGNPISFVDPFGETIYKGPNNSYSDIPPPAGQPCLRAIEKYGAIIGWEPCNPPTPPSSDPCPPPPPAPPPLPPTPPGNGPGSGTPGAGPGSGGAGPGSGGTNQSCYWACISASVGTYIVDTMTLGIFTDGVFPSLFEAASVNNSLGQRIFWGGMKWASRGFGIIHVLHGAWGLNQSAPAMCEKACAE